LRIPVDKGEEAYVVRGEEVLACQSLLVEDCAIEINLFDEIRLVGISEFEASVVNSLDTGLEIVRFEPAVDCWNDGLSVTKVINQSIGRSLDYSPKALRQLSVWIASAMKNEFVAPGPDRPIYLTVWNGLVLQIRTLESAPVYGLGIDIGTTTIAFALVELTTGAVRKTLSVLNSQRRYGADVISRIQKGGEGQLQELQEMIRADISREIFNMCETESDSVVQLVIAGNTTMLHLLLGLRADSLALFPFNPVTTEFVQLRSTELFGVSPDCDVTLLPSVGAFMGADVVAGMVYCRMQHSHGVTLLIDVGTNGEVVIRGKDCVLCVSTAAGPAFEGANISWGTGSVPGAIDKFDMRGTEVDFNTIGNVPPVGICGSGVVDIVAVCLRKGLVDRTGRFVSDEMGQEGLKIARTYSGEWISFTQKDLREFQLAKAAIRCGIEILVQEFGCHWDEVTTVYLAGGFGTRMDTENAIEVGLFPAELQGKIRSVGNSSLGGIVHYMLYRESRLAVAELVRAATVLDLSKHPSFNDLFMSRLMF
jgi:uncharacterized 2Fe-2S/4Fe-4S cluster protein (DUF4445 family)